MSAVPVQVLVIAKPPVPGRVKTRLCPPCTPAQAAAVAAAALADTVAAVGATPAVRRTLVLATDLGGRVPVPPGWSVVPQRGSGLGERLAGAYADTALPGVASLLVGMDTPQLTPALLADAARALSRPSVADAVLGPAADGGWWLLGLRDPAAGGVLPEVPMSTAGTGAATVAALRARGLTVVRTAELRDVDTAEDAWTVAAGVPDSGFAAAVRAHVPAMARATPLG